MDQAQDGLHVGKGNGGRLRRGWRRSSAIVGVGFAGTLVLSACVSTGALTISAFAGTAGTAGYSGNGAAATSAALNNPGGLIVDKNGNVLVADYGNNVVRVVAGTTGTFYGQAMTAGDIYTIAGNATAATPPVALPSGSGYVWTGTPASGVAAVSAELDGPSDVAIDANGNVLIADSALYVVQAVAESTGTFYGQAMTAGDIYTIAAPALPTSPFAAATVDGNPTVSVTVDFHGNVVFGTSSGVNVLAGATGTFYGQAMAAGGIYTVAGSGVPFTQYDNLQSGGSATNGGLYEVSSVKVDVAGNLVVAETEGNLVWVVAEGTGTYYGQAMTAGDAYIIAGGASIEAGNGLADGGYSGDSGPGASAQIDSPTGVAIDAGGNVLIADYGNDLVRVVAGATTTGTTYGQSMTAGDIYTIAGTADTAGSSGNGGSATSADLSSPGGIAVGPNVTNSVQQVFVSDSGNDEIRGL